MFQLKFQVKNEDTTKTRGLISHLTYEYTNSIITEILTFLLSFNPMF